MLYPKDSETREVRSLDGVWKFKRDDKNEGLDLGWYTAPLDTDTLMPVPASYNDVTQDIRTRDHIGFVWYEREFFARKEENYDYVLRIGSASHHAFVYVNGTFVCEHRGGFLPFEADVTSILQDKGANRLTIAVDNRLHQNSLPFGQVLNLDDRDHPKGTIKQEIHHDFYNYGGIHRPVRLLKLPRQRITDIAVKTESIDKKSSSAVLSWKVETCEGVETDIEISDKTGNMVARLTGATGTATLEAIRYWSQEDPCLYNFCVKISQNGQMLDTYTERIGIRTVEVRGKQFLLNGEPVYFKGFGKHEDMDIKGKGHDDAVNVKDFNLLKWINANSFRTSHYPYSEEIMNLADEYGFLVIDEVPAVGFNFWTSEKSVFSEGIIDEKTLEHHLEVMGDLIQRDKNHPSVVMWCIGNEARTDEEAAGPYFQKVADLCREQDASRPVMLVETITWDTTCAAQHVDVIGINRYWGWYLDPGDLSFVDYQFSLELKGWYERFGKPVMVTEYGADCIAGMHSDPPVQFSEEYQRELIKTFNDIMDRFPHVIGEHIWNFADFATKQGITRIGGNKKGIFTRQRQPKAAAFYVKERWQNRDPKSD